ncbi:wax ester/triacylglycerol synthase domain-containing protein [Mycobacterium asiaticum]|nr:wax ester/triacylglycerol synthase domain-containing protein [Mycobacterium asiaticum]
MAADTGFFGCSAPGQHSSMAVAAVAIVEGRAPDRESVEDLLAERIAPGLRVAADLSRHVQRMALPQPGDDRELFHAITHALEHPLEFDGPRWECWIIEGLRHDRWAILIRVHHSLTSLTALSPAHLLIRLCADAPNDAFREDVAPQHISPPQTVSQGWTDALLQVPATLGKAVARVATLPISWLLPTDAATTRRHYRTVWIPRATVESVSRKFGVQPDDVALAAVTEGFRTVLKRRGEKPRADMLRTVGSALSGLPVQHNDPVQQLRAVHLMSDHTGQGPNPISPFALCAKAMQAVTRPLGQTRVTVAGTATGPRRQLHLLGRRVERLLPIPPTAPGLSTGVAVFGYGDELVFGITAGYDDAAEMQHLAGGIELGMARLAALNDDSVVLFDRRRKRPARGLPINATRRAPSTSRARVRH